MKRFKDMKVGTKLVAIMLLVSLIPLAVVGIFSFVQSKATIENSVYQLQEVFFDQKTSEIDKWFSSLVANAKIAAATRSTYQSMNVLKSVDGDIESTEWKERVQMMNQGFNILINEFELPLLNIIDTDGRIVHSSDGSIINGNLSQRGYFQKSIQGQISTSEFFYSDLINQYCMAIAVPIYSEGTKGDVVGVFSVVVGQHALSSKITQGLETVGRTADTYIVDQNGMLITVPRFGNREAFKDIVESEAISILSSQIRSGSNFSSHSQYINPRGERVLGNYQVFHLGDISLGMIFEIDSKEAFEEVNRLAMVVIAICLLAMFIVVVTGIMFSKGFKKPISKLVEVSKEIADGKLDVNIDIDSGDEIGDLGRAFAKMTNNVNDIMLNIDLSSEQVASGARQLSDSSQALSQGATEQASSIEEISSSVEELASQTEKNAENAQKANELSNKVKDSAEQGNKKMQDMLKSMDEINDSSSNISKIIKVIDEIAFQTNILALNAAVEAARAGQYGKGFAVVAEEVRNLAARSANAAKETTDMIEGSIRKVENGTKYANDTANALNEIVEGVARAVELVEEIAAASIEQKAGINQISSAISQVSQVVQTNSATSQEAAAASQELSSQAEFLKEMIGKFELKKSKSKMNIEKINPEVLKLLEEFENNRYTEKRHEGERSKLKDSEFSGKAKKETRQKINISLNDDDYGKY